MNQNTNNYLAEERIGKLLLKFSIPCIMSLLVSSLYNIVDQIFIVGFVYEENKEVLGCIFALRKISGNKEEIYINEMAVLPERQGQGIGNSPKYNCIHNECFALIILFFVSLKASKEIMKPVEDTYQKQKQFISDGVLL